MIVSNLVPGDLFRFNNCSRAPAVFLDVYFETQDPLALVRLFYLDDVDRVRWIYARRDAVFIAFPE